jgi:hypothetical protein
MVGASVASFPRRPRLHLKRQNVENLFPSSVSLVDRCHKIAVEARGPGYLDKELTVYDAATSYLLALAGVYTINYKQGRLYFGETLTIMRVIGAYKQKDKQYGIEQPELGRGQEIPPWAGQAGETNEFIRQTGEPVDFIKQEIARRIFWCAFTGVR